MIIINLFTPVNIDSTVLNVVKGSMKKDIMSHMRNLYARDFEYFCITTN